VFAGQKNHASLILWCKYKFRTALFFSDFFGGMTSVMILCGGHAFVAGFYHLGGSIVRAPAK
jgi:hypothetical protein